MALFTKSIFGFQLFEKKWDPQKRKQRNIDIFCYDVELWIIKLPGKVKITKTKTPIYRGKKERESKREKIEEEKVVYPKLLHKRMTRKKDTKERHEIIT